MSAYNHAEAFRVMTYASVNGDFEIEVWNSRDGVTPLIITIDDEHGPLSHKGPWGDDPIDPYRIPRIGDYVFVNRSSVLGEPFVIRVSEDDLETYGWAPSELTQALEIAPNGEPVVTLLWEGQRVTRTDPLDATQIGMSIMTSSIMLKADAEWYAAVRVVADDETARHIYNALSAFRARKSERARRDASVATLTDSHLAEATVTVLNLDDLDLATSEGQALAAERIREAFLSLDDDGDGV